jgi:hypothetical protein
MKNLTLSCCFILSLCLFSSCIARNLSFGNGKDWIPADFDAKNNILLIESSLPLRGQERKMEEYMKKNYPYRYEFVTYREIMEGDGKYENASVYHFALVSTSGTIRTMNINHPVVGVQDFYVYDRLKNIRYPATTKGSYKKIVTFKPVINTILKNTR